MIRRIAYLNLFKTLTRSIERSVSIMQISHMIEHTSLSKRVNWFRLFTFFRKKRRYRRKKKKQNLRLFLNIISWVSLLHDSRIFILNKSCGNIGRYQRIDYLYNYLFIKKYTDNPLPPHLVTYFSGGFAKNLILFTTVNEYVDYPSSEVLVSPKLPSEVLTTTSIPFHLTPTLYMTNMSMVSNFRQSMILLTINQLYKI